MQGAGKQDQQSDCRLASHVPVRGWMCCNSVSTTQLYCSPARASRRSGWWSVEGQSAPWVRAHPRRGAPATCTICSFHRAHRFHPLSKLPAGKSTKGLHSSTHQNCSPAHTQPCSNTSACRTSDGYACHSLARLLRSAKHACRLAPLGPAHSIPHARNAAQNEYKTKWARQVARRDLHCRNIHSCTPCLPRAGLVDVDLSQSTDSAAVRDRASKILAPGWGPPSAASSS